jgi:hypothetical protein
MNAHGFCCAHDNSENTCDTVLTTVLTFSWLASQHADCIFCEATSFSELSRVLTHQGHKLSIQTRHTRQTHESAAIWGLAVVRDLLAKLGKSCKHFTFSIPVEAVLCLFRSSSGPVIHRSGPWPDLTPSGTKVNVFRPYVQLAMKHQGMASSLFISAAVRLE